MADVNFNSKNVSLSVFDKLDAKTVATANTDYWAKNVATYDITRAGSWGFLPMIGGVDSGKNVHKWMYNQPYIKRDLIPIVLQTPRVFDLLPKSHHWHLAVKALIEVHAKNIEGLNASLTVETSTTEIGLEGAEYQDIINVIREASNVSITVDEKYGIPIEILLDVWIRFGMMDPDTKAPLVTTLFKDKVPDAYTPEWWTCSVLLIEPDVLLRKAVHTWLVVNLFPKANPDITGARKKKDAKETKEITIEMGGIALPPTNVHVAELGNKILNNLKLYTKTPDDILLPVTDVDASLKGKQNKQYAYGFENTGNSVYKATNQSAFETVSK